MKHKIEEINNGEVPAALIAQKKIPPTFDMNEIVGTKDILFLCFDTLRYDVALSVQENGESPNINQKSSWTKAHASGNFTYPSHHAMFAGYLPIPYEASSLFENGKLFFPSSTGMGRNTPPNSFAFEGATFVEGLFKVGYETICIGGVAFFDKRSEIGSVFPSMFSKSYWNPSFACPVKKSTENQINFAVKKLSAYPDEKRVFMYMNISAIHYPNYFYIDGERNDSVKTHAAALKYVDSCLPLLFDAFEKRGGCFVIACSDHGSCYGEDGKQFHGFNHEIVNTVPYMEFMI